MIKRTFDPGFRIELHQKDLNLALSTGARSSASSLPNTATAQELFNACAAHGGSAWDHSAMVRALETLANFEIGAEAGKSLTSSERSGHVLRTHGVAAHVRRGHQRRRSPSIACRRTCRPHPWAA